MFEGVTGILFDLDGVVHVGDSPVPGAADALGYLRSRGVPFRFLTNTTTRSVDALSRQMAAMGLPIEQGEIFTTHRVAASYLRQLGSPPCYLLVADQTLPAYKGIPQDDTNPEWIVIGDIGERWTYSLLNRVFTLVMNGAEILALHKGRYWESDGGLRIDIGPFVTGLEYATCKTATVVGKPSATFFAMGLDDLGLRKKEVVMIGDDIDSDVGGAQAAGIKGVLVKTGKYRADAVARSSVRPDAVIESIADLRHLL